MPYEFTGIYEPDNSLEISGLYDVDARLYFGERGEIVFRASGDIPVPVAAEQEARLAFSGEGFYFSPDDWSLGMQRLVASGVPFGPVPESRIELAGNFGPTGARLRHVGYEDPFSILSGTGEIDWNLEALAGSLAVVLGDANESGPSEQYEIRAAYADGSIEASASATALPLLRIGVETVRGTLDGSIDLSGRLDALSASAELRLTDGKFNNDPIDLAATVELDPTNLRVTDASARYVRSRAENVSGSLSREDGRLSISGTLVQNGEGGSIAVGLVADGYFTGLDEFTDVEHADFEGALTLTDLPVHGDFPRDWEFLVERLDGTGVARGGPSDAVILTVDPTGEFRARVDDPLPLHFEAVGLLEGGTIEADLIGVRADVARLWSILDTQGFSLTGGVGTGSLRIVGPLNDPDFYGTLVAEGVSAEVDLLRDPIGPGRTFVVFDEKILTVRETSIASGSSSARVSVEATLDRWLPEQFRVLVDTEGDAGLRIANDFGGVAIDGIANGTVRIDGNRATTRIRGDITASSTSITLSEVPGDPPDADEGDDLRVDMTIRSGRGVEFRWPSNTFPILRGFADVGEVVRMTHDSTSSSFSVTGGIDIQGGEIFYFDRSFYIREGRITFDEDEQKFDPLLTVNAEIREVADEGPVEI
ncbi:MAG: translocation/assembly module TamB domain-containing protein, partial [Spirochaetota bacterium]